VFLFGLVGRYTPDHRSVRCLLFSPTPVRECLVLSRLRYVCLCDWLGRAFSIAMSNEFNWQHTQVLEIPTEKNPIPSWRPFPTVFLSLVEVIPSTTIVH
jgi:hypothetical protein